ncbi:hypothetical protein G6F46_015614 [Rhizopus delemar]|nr:hypothetical protein G6F55_014524 [Rhizopus delemar]KAG1605442.1 hypothetical protein G6F45_014203 [Rhizopus arrhizus]KAG1472934.1 hypothetical protein G6F54_014407 [Rhizopus delemar]KAG1480125.1 hypothetical protein G6F53_014221 [Rhizopus delemar]KAG1525762.1 hypothetical protein G6F50_018434 [Rhizopus delemar]
MERDEEGWDIYQSIEYAKALKKIGVDVIDVSGGGNRAKAAYSLFNFAKLYQVEMANAIKHQANIATAAVG